MEEYADLYFTPSAETCLIKKNSTKIITNAYEGIPETLLLNIIAWSSLLLLFTILRNRAWDYGRLALVQSEKLMQLFYGNMDDVATIAEESSDSLIYRDQGCCSWIPAIFTISKEKFFTRCGPDAVLYLSFQRYLMYLMTITMVLSVSVILPINFQGSLQGDEYSFGHTTISNLEPTSHLLWVHITISILLVPITLLIMRKCALLIPTKQFLSKSIMVTNIAPQHRKTEDIMGYFNLLYPSIQIKEVQLAYDISKLTVYDRERENAREAKIYCEAHSKNNLQSYPKGCFICCCCCPSVNALEYYTAEEMRLTETVKCHREIALAKPLGIAFVTLEKASDAQLIVKHFYPGTHREWILSQAPAPSDIFWENLSVDTKYWYLKAIFVNFILFVILFFLTTPAVIVNMLNAFYLSHNITYKLNNVLSEFLPTLLLWTMSALLPVFVAYSDEWLTHWTRSKQNQAVMKKSFIFLLFMVLILPSLGLTSAQALVEYSLESHNRTFRWECVFLPDKGAFFVNYVITSALIGTALELIRFPELSRFLWTLSISRSRAEIVNVQRTVLSEYAYGINYAWTILIYTISVTYSLVCPLITPFGLLYLIMKHIGDRHNLYFAYRPSYMGIEGRHIHISAIKMVRIGVVLMQATLTALTVVRGGNAPMYFISIGILLVTCCLFTLPNPFPTCIPKSTSDSDQMNVNFKYVAPVLQLSANISNPESPVFHLDYGSAGTGDVGCSSESDDSKRY